MRYVNLAFVLFVSAILAVPAFAQGTPSSKATAAINTAVGCKVSNATTIGDPIMTCKDLFGHTDLEVKDNYVTVMTSTIKVSNSQSLFVSPSLVTGLYTQTKTSTSTKTTSTTSQT